MSVGLQSRIRGSLLRVVSYNPMSLIQSRRALDISEELSADLIGLQGTRSRFVPRPGVADRCGTQIAQLAVAFLSKQSGGASGICVKSTQLHRFCKEESEVHGCALERSDVAMLVAYFPPKPSQQKEWKGVPAHV